LPGQKLSFIVCASTYYNCSSSESCIKGHRSSSCHHTDRPLFEIKKKGRPVSQCEKCRELRQSRRVHSKCNCPQDETPSRGLLLPSSSTKCPIYSTLPPQYMLTSSSSPEVHSNCSCAPQWPSGRLARDLAIAYSSRFSAARYASIINSRFSSKATAQSIRF
jgi:hypothetical protein